MRHVADEAVGGRPVVIDLSVRRLYCTNPGCTKVTFVEQVEGLTERYQRPSPGLRRVVEAVVVALADSRLLFQHDPRARRSRHGRSRLPCGD